MLKWIFTPRLNAFDFCCLSSMVLIVPHLGFLATVGIYVPVAMFSDWMERRL